MHPRVKQIFEEHDEWLKNGGDHGIPGVQRANLAAIVDRHLTGTENELARTLLTAAVKRGEPARRLIGQLLEETLLKKPVVSVSFSRAEKQPVESTKPPSEPPT